MRGIVLLDRRFFAQTAPQNDGGRPLDRYSEWLLAQRANGWDVVDVHGPMKRFLAKERARDPNFRLAGDGVHVDDMGHWLITRQILLHCGVPARDLAEAENGEK